MRHRPRAVALVASLRPDLRTVSDCACHRSGSAHACPPARGRMMESLKTWESRTLERLSFRKFKRKISRWYVYLRECNFFIEREDNWRGIGFPFSMKIARDVEYNDLELVILVQEFGLESFPSVFFPRFRAQFCA